MLPSLKVSSDTRVAQGFDQIIYSCRVVNDGRVPVEIRTLRIVLGKERTLPMPATDEELRSYLLENEKPIPISPTVLQPGQSQRFATSQDRIKAALREAGFASGSIKYEVAVVDSLDDSYTLEQSAIVYRQDHEP